MSGNDTTEALGDQRAFPESSAAPVAEPAEADAAKTSSTEPALTAEEAVEGQRLARRLLDGLNTAVLGQEQLVEMVVVCLLARGHVLLEGLPGLGKTELVKALSRLLGLSFQRIQFTPDLSPSDIIGSLKQEDFEGSRRTVFHRGPVFANLVLAEEINRATPKTQTALLDAMQDRRVSLSGESHVLPTPFFVVATQNPIELEGTFPLPESQVDRFMFKLEMPNVSAEVLQRIILTRRHGQAPTLREVCSARELDLLFTFVDRVQLPEPVANYIARLVTATRPDGDRPVHEVRQYVRYGASPRAAIALAEASRAAAVLAGQPRVAFDHVKRVAPAVLCHRVILDYSARLDGWTPRRMIDRVLQAVPEVVEPPPEPVT